MFPGCISQTTGRLRVKVGSPPAGAAFNHGVACGADFIYGNLVAPDLFVNGLPVLEDGTLALSAGTPNGFSNGIPFDDDAVSQDNAAPTHFQNGLPFNGDQIAIEIVL